MSNCLFEATVQKTRENCSCTPEAIGFDAEAESCQGEKILCEKEIFCKSKIKEIF